MHVPCVLSGSAVCREDFATQFSGHANLSGGPGTWLLVKWTMSSCQWQATLWDPKPTVRSLQDVLQCHTPDASGSVGLVHSTFGFYFEVKQHQAWLVLGWVTARVLDCDCEVCPTHWTGCQAGQVVHLLGLGTMVATVSCWPLPSGMSVRLMVPTWQ